MCDATRAWAKDCGFGAWAAAMGGCTVGKGTVAGANIFAFQLNGIAETVLETVRTQEL